MNSKQPVRSAQRFMSLLRPANSVTAAHNAITWLRPTVKLPHDAKPVIAFPDASPSLCRLGSLDVRLARSKGDIKRAQKLRYKVFYKDGPAIADAATMLARRDKDRFDAICDHQLVTDHAASPSLSGRQPVVGTYRLLRQDIADRHGGFYTDDEFDLSGMIARHPNLRFLELGRSCVLPRYRTKRTVELLWHGISRYVAQHGIDVMIGCASFESTDPARLSLPLSFLHHYASAPDAWCARARSSRYVEMNRMAKEAIDTKAAMHQLPPLIKGYLRVGAMIGEGAVIDYQFGTIDVLIVMPMASVKSRYREHFGAGAPVRTQ